MACHTDHPLHISNIRKMSLKQQQEFYEGLTPQQAVEYKFDWKFHARKKQMLPDQGWSEALILAGRGFGKTRTGAEWIRNCVEVQGCRRIALIGPTVSDVRDVMFGGESGLENISPPWNKPRYIHSKALIEWDNGAVAKVISAEEPEALRGPQYDAILWDEPARCKNAQDVYDGLQFALRLTSKKGYPPRLVMTTTPRPIPLIRQLVKEAEEENSNVILVTGSTDENLENLDPNSVRKMYAKYEGTRLGRQELHAEVLNDFENALWTAESIDNSKRINRSEENVIEFSKTMKRIVMGVDPSGGGKRGSDEQGIVVCGLDEDNEYHILSDETCSKSPDGWANHIKNVYEKFNCDKIVVEKNFGGDLVESVLRAQWKDAPIKMIHASKSKVARAEPVSMLYEQGSVFHFSDFTKLEEQMSYMTTDGFEGSGSPDRVDALVWAVTELQTGQSNKFSFKVNGRMY